MSMAPSLSSELREVYAEESARIQRDFAATGDGRAAVGQRTRLVENILKWLWQDLISPEEHGPRNFALVATGGFGRGWLFPYSDIDLLFRCSPDLSENFLISGKHRATMCPNIGFPCVFVLARL